MVASNDSIDKSILNLRIRLRDDLRIRIHIFQNQTCFVIEDPFQSDFYRIGLDEYTFVSLLDGSKTIADVISRSKSIKSGRTSLTESDAITLCQWLIDCDLAVAINGRSTDSDKRRILANAKRSGSLNLITQRFAIARPDRFLSRFAAMAKVIFCWPVFFVWLALVLWGSVVVWTRSDDFFSDTTSVIFLQHNWVQLLGMWFMLKVLHELGHALACKRLGGHVQEAGILFILFTPLPYVDVTSAWRFDDKWKRILVSVAGMYVELFVAAIAAIVWAHSEVEIVQQAARNLVVTASAITVLFNANPLMRFDGYYVLVDLLEVPNLAAKGQAQIAYYLRRYLLGQMVEPPTDSIRKRFWFFLFGVATLLWKVLVVATLSILAESMFFGAGVLLAVFVIVAWWVIPTIRFLLCGVMGTKQVRPNRAYFALVMIAIGTLFFCCIRWVPWYSTFSVPAVVDYDPLIEVRSPVSGTIRKIHVQNGQKVSPGQLLVELVDENLAWELNRVRIELNVSKIRQRRFRSNQQITAAEAEATHCSALQLRLNQLESDQKHLNIRAESSGTIVSCHVASRVGDYLRRGSPVVDIGDDQAKRLHVLIPQKRIAHFRSDGPVRLRAKLKGRGLDSIDGCIERIEPSATDELRYDALGAHAGGSLPVRLIDNQDKSPSVRRWQLEQPHFIAIIKPATTHHLFAGQTGVARLHCRPGTVGQVFAEWLSNWVHTRREIVKHL